MPFFLQVMVASPVGDGAVEFGLIAREPGHLPRGRFQSGGQAGDGWMRFGHTCHCVSLRPEKDE